MISRDSYNPSLWQASVEPYKSKNRVDTNEVFDVAIVGGGITGLSTALLLQEAGLKCIILEAENLAFGTTGGTTAHLNTLLDTTYAEIQQNFNEETAQQAAQAALAAISLIRSNIDKYGIDCNFQEASAFLFAQDKKQEEELEEILQAAKEVALPFSNTDSIPVPILFSRALKADKQAKFHPLNYVYGLARAYEDLGGAIIQYSRVTAVTQKEPMELQTSTSRVRAKNIIYATHIPPGVNLLHLRCTPYRSYAMAVTLKNEPYPEDLSYDMEDPYHYYRSQEVDGNMYLIAGGKDHKTGEETDTGQHFTDLEAKIRSHFRVDEIVRRWSSQYYESADGLPYIGLLPGHGQHTYVATGFGGNGMIYSAISAMVFKTMITQEKNPLIRPDLFSPGRLKPVAGFTNFVTHNADVVKNYFGRLFPAAQLAELSDLAPGEGKLVNYEKEKIGIYKDSSGHLFAVDPVCKHLKCEVKWNSAERSWDCPCHGARYNYDGKLVTGPADHSLNQIDIGQ